MQSLKHNDAKPHHRAPAPGRLDMPEASRLLALDPIAVLAALYPGARPTRKELRIGGVDGARGASMVIAIGGHASLRWLDHATGERGDALELVAKALFGGDRLKALAWARVFLRMDDSTPPQGRPRPAAVRQVKPEPEQPANQVWRRIAEETTAIAGSRGEIYLAHRGLRLPDDDYDAVLRYHASCPFGSERHPAMVAMMTDPVTNQLVGIHRTALAPDGRGKAQIASPKMMMGHAGVIRLTADEDVTQGLGICEGVETGLAIIQRAEWKPVWAATSAGGIASFPVLAGIESLTIFADHDAPKANGKQPGLDAARECRARWQAAGREAQIKLPPIGLDWDDAFKKVAA